MRAKYVLSLCSPDAHISHHTAAVLWGAWVPDDPDVHVSVPEGGRWTKRRGVRTHRTNRRARVTEHLGMHVSSPEQTFLDLAGPLSLVDLVVLGDSLVRRGLTTRKDLIQASETWRGHGARLARRAARMVRVGVDSPMETRLRMLIVLAGLPEPVVNHVRYRDDGRWELRLDLSWPRWRVAVEYDGRQHAQSDVQWQRDLDRREQLDGIRWRLVVVRAPGIWVEPERTLERIVEALREHAGVAVAIRRDEWRQHFPGRASL